MRWLLVILFTVEPSLFAAPSPAPLAAACRALLPQPATALDAVPFALIAHAAVRDVDDSQKAKVHEKESDKKIFDCRGGETETGWLDIQPPKDPGQLTDGGRQKLEDGRMAIWIVSGADLGAPATLFHGFLAIVRVDRGSLVVDSIGEWENGEDAKRVLRRQKVGSGSILVEPSGHTGTGGGTDSVGITVWMEKNGRIVRVGGIDTEGLDEDMGTDGPRWLLEWKSKVTYEDSIHVIEKDTWTLNKAKRKEVVHTTLDRHFVLDGEKLVERPATEERKPPHPANAPALPAPNPAN